jgi:hypothetical protein
MESVINSEMTKFLMIVGAGVAALGVLFVNLVSKAQGSFKPYLRRILAYILVTLLLFLLIPFVTLQSLDTAFIVFQIYFLVLGLVHYHYMHRFLVWSRGPRAFYRELSFTLLLALLCTAGFALLYRFLHRDGLSLAMAASALFFVIPLLFFQTFREAMAVPPKIVKEWFYPVDREVEEPEDAKMKNLLVISFEFRKQTNDPHYTNFRARAPVDMEFGKLFYFFINDYNERHPSGQIHFVNGSREPHGWIFYKKPRWYTVITQYVDGEKTIFNNRIRENEVIICERSLV